MRKWAAGAVFITIGLLLAASTWMQAADPLPKWAQPLRPVPPVVTGLASAVQMYWGYKSLPTVASRRQRAVRVYLRALAQQMHEGGALKNPRYDMLSFHVWEVPRWYRRGFRFRLRQWLKRMYERTRRKKYVGRPAWRPQLRLVAFSTDRPGFEPSGHRFRKGEALVGTILNARRPSIILGIDYEAEPYVALRKSEDEWNDADPGYTMGLDYAIFLQLADRYGQAVGTQIIGNQGEAIGVLTMEAERGYPERLFDNEGVAENLVWGAKTLSRILRGKSTAR